MMVDVTVQRILIVKLICLLAVVCYGDTGGTKTLEKGGKQSSTDDKNIFYTHNNKPKRCAYENVLSNHTFILNTQAGVFTHLGHTRDIHQCKQMCCQVTDCDVAFMPENHCYSVSCYSDKHCETTPAAAREAFNVKLVKVRRVVIPIPDVDDVAEEEITRSSSPGVIKQRVPIAEKKAEVTQEVIEPEVKQQKTLSHSSYEGQMLCTHSPVSYNVTLKGGSNSGNFTDLGLVEDMDICISLCCEIPSCDLAFLIGGRCVATECHTEELCQTIKSKPSNKSPKIAYIRRKEKHTKTRTKLARPVNNQQQIINANHIPEKPAPVLRPSTCQARKIYNNVTLLGGMRAGNYTALGRADHLEDCIGRACDLNEGHLALMLGQYCYSVMCNNQRTCQTIPAKPSHLRPKVAYLVWTQEPIEQDIITNMAESDFFVNHKRYPRCKRSHIMYNHTLRGGLRAGNFSMLAAVDDIEVCAALCCEEKYCDLALMIGDNCYAGDCASPELCAAVPVPPGSLQRSQIAYITAPGRKKAEDHANNSDWSYIYLVVSALVIGVSVLGTAWTFCLCALKRHRRKMENVKRNTIAENLNNDTMDNTIKGTYLFGTIEPVGTSSRNESSINNSNASDLDDQDNNVNKIPPT